MRCRRSLVPLAVSVGVFLAAAHSAHAKAAAQCGPAVNAVAAESAFPFHGGGTWHPEASETILFAIGRAMGRCE